MVKGTNIYKLTLWNKKGRFKKLIARVRYGNLEERNKY